MHLPGALVFSYHSLGVLIEVAGPSSETPRDRASASISSEVIPAVPSQAVQWLGPGEARILQSACSLGGAQPLRGHSARVFLHSAGRGYSRARHLPTAPGRYRSLGEGSLTAANEGATEGRRLRQCPGRFARVQGRSQRFAAPPPTLPPSPPARSWAAERLRCFAQPAQWGFVLEIFGYRRENCSRPTVCTPSVLVGCCPCTGIRLRPRTYQASFSEYEGPPPAVSHQTGRRAFRSYEGLQSSICSGEFFLLVRICFACAKGMQGPSQARFWTFPRTMKTCPRPGLSFAVRQDVPAPR